MCTDRVHPSAIGTNTKPNQTISAHDYADDPSLPPQRHAGAVGLGPNYPLGAVSSGVHTWLLPRFDP